ncbi:MAG TPA: DUF1080 domain-containing protein [Vicinamibacterales bacterium]|nr:DUF1080 domain-containing protein [Vicinamibacterales bacterium]
MIRRLRWLVGVAALSVAVGAVPTTQQAKLGYDNTPMQPDGKWRIHDGTRPQPRIVTPGPSAGMAAPPSDAVVLLGPDGSLAAWEGAAGKPAAWPASGGVVQTGNGGIQTKESFGDVQLHVEFATPIEVKGDSQGRGNSGVFLAGVFEIQVLDSYNNPTYPDGQAAAMYGQFPPLVNASRAPGEWQAYDITFTAPRFSGNKLESPAVATVLHNGVMVQNARTFWGPTAHQRIDPYVPESARGPIKLQDHQNPVRYRNIWLRRLE